MKVIFSDVDGTLVTHDYILSSDSRNAIRDFKGKFVLATGRTYSDIQRLKIECDAICSNGGEIIVNGKHVFEAFIEHEKALSAIKYLIDNNYLFIIYASGIKYYADYLDSEIVCKELVDLSLMHSKELDEVVKGIDIYANVIYKNHQRVQDILSVISEKNITKIEAYNSKDKKSEVNRLKKNIDLNIFSSHISNIEISPFDINKGNAINKFIENNVTTKDIKTYAIGDGFNDLEMFACVDFAIAMGNSPDKVKEAADLVVSSIEDGGFLEAMEFIVNDELKHN